ncbi:MAG: GHKL domain-containing protein [Lachnospiraceae bacterium]|nr:GHKL domain-containing protein [Lachnospiraceae bacterium]
MSVYDLVYALSNFFMAYTTYKFIHVFYSVCRVKPWIERTAYLLYATVLTLVYFTLPLPIVFLTANILLVFGIGLLYEGKPIKALFASIIIYACSMLVEVFFGTAVFTINAYVFSPIEVPEIFPIILIRITTYVLTRLITGFQNVRNNVYIPPAYWISLFLIPLCTLILILSTLSNPNLSPLLGGLSSSCAILINLVAFYIYDRLSALMEEKLALTMSQEQSRFYESQVNLMKNSLEEMRILRHDLNNRLVPVYSLLQQGDTDDALKQLTQLGASWQKREEYSASGNPTVDALINYKLQHIDASIMNIHTNIQLPAALQLPDFDLAVVLGNLLDNALEALATAKEPSLSLFIRYSKGCLLIQITNSFDGILLSDRNKKGLLSRKKDQKDHGLGLKSVRQIAEKYDGLLELEPDGQEFTARVLLYL